MWEKLYQNLDFFPTEASTMARDVDAIYLFLVALTAFFTALVIGVMIFCAIRFRRKSDDEVPKPVFGSTVLEIVWSAVPFVITMGLFGWGSWIYFKYASPPADAMDVHVVGKQWMWKLQHPDGKREINQLHVPVNQPVRLIITSEDVIHSFFVPAFRVKRDAVPGRYATAWFEATKVGEYHLFCSQYCGNEHSKMIGTVIVMKPEDYDKWLRQDTQGGYETPIKSGERMFSELRCDTCHNETDGGNGPALAGLFGTQVNLSGGGSVVADESYIRESILDPKQKVVSGFKAVMPTFQGQISEEQVFELISYIKTLEVK